VAILSLLLLDPFRIPQDQKINALAFRPWLKPLARFFLTRSIPSGSENQCMSLSLSAQGISKIFLDPFDS
jgi:hypothetical protein